MSDQTTGLVERLEARIARAAPGPWFADLIDRVQRIYDRWQDGEDVGGVEAAEAFMDAWPTILEILRSYETQAEEIAGLREDARLLNAMREESWNLECFDIPTGGDDYDIGWRVVGHWMAKPHRRVVAEVFTDDPREALRTALSHGEKTDEDADAD